MQKRPVRSSGQPKNREIMEPDSSKLIEDTNLKFLMKNLIV